MTDDPMRHALADTALATEVRAWRRVHPDATLTEIERELDTRLAAARAGLLAEVIAVAPDDEARCPDCGGPLVRRGARTRTLRTAGDAPVPDAQVWAVSGLWDRGFPPR